MIIPRKPNDPEWSLMLIDSAGLVPDDGDECNQLIDIFELDGQRPHGCSLMPGRKSEDDEWRAALYLGGVWRYIAKGTIYQCARLRDYALWYFRQYRTRPRHDEFRYNFPKSEAALAEDSPVWRYLERLERYLLDSGALVPPGQKKANSLKAKRESTRQWKKKQTLRYKLDRLTERVAALEKGQP